MVIYSSIQIHFFRHLNDMSTLNNFLVKRAKHGTNLQNPFKK